MTRHTPSLQKSRTRAGMRLVAEAQAQREHARGGKQRCRLTSETPRSRATQDRAVQLARTILTFAPRRLCRSGRGALDDYSSAAGVPSAAVRDQSEAALGGLQAGACRLERLAE